jgi:hypothetical protein
MKVWLDARREPEVDWVWSRTVQGAITMLRGGCVDRVSFAPDQPDFVEAVVDWMIDNDVHPRRGVHTHEGGVRLPRGFLGIPRQATP